MILAADKANGIIEALAAAYDGEVTLRMGPLSPYPEMTFYHARRRAFVDLVTRDNAERVTVTLPATPDPKMRLFDLHLFTRRRYDWLLSLIGRKDSRRQEVEQAGAFRLWTSDRRRLAHYFREGALFRLKELALLPSEDDLAVAWTPTRFILQKPVIEFEYDAVQMVVTHTLKLLEALEDGAILPFGVPTEPLSREPLIRTSGVVWDPVVGACRVCGDALEGRVIYCASCSTPHHPDCWEYTSQCAVYACGGKRWSEKMAR